MFGGRSVGNGQKGVRQEGARTAALASAKQATAVVAIAGDWVSDSHLLDGASSSSRGIITRLLSSSK